MCTWSAHLWEFTEQAVMAIYSIRVIVMAACPAVRATEIRAVGVYACVHRVRLRANRATSSTWFVVTSASDPVLFTVGVVLPGVPVCPVDPLRACCSASGKKSL